MICPHCRAFGEARKKGFYLRKNAVSPKIARFFCRRCRRCYSEQTHTVSAGHKRPDLNRLVYLLLASGVSQRRTAKLLGTTQVTVARKLMRLSQFARQYQAERLEIMRGNVTEAVFDEMETFEHTKCKPVAIALAVEDRSRLILAAQVARMPSKGRLAAISRRRYGRRRDDRAQALSSVLGQVAAVRGVHLRVKSDQCPRYPKLVARLLPGAVHETYKGRRACTVGQGEMKVGGFDPIFALNHSAAMFRDNVKCLTRRTWCTTKRRDRLQCRLDLYVCAHNAMIAPLPISATLRREDFRTIAQGGAVV